MFVEGGQIPLMTMPGPPLIMIADFRNIYIYFFILNLPYSSTVSYNSRLQTLRANVTNGQTFGGNRPNINSSRILMLGRP